MDEYSLWLQTNVSSARQDQVRAFADDLADLLCYHDAGAWQGEKVSLRRQSLVALGAALPRRRRASPPAPTFEKDVLAETPSSAAPAAGRRRRTRPVPGSLPAVTPLPAPKKRAPPPEPPRRKKPCFGGASVETLEAVESRFLGATLPLQ